MKKVIIIQIIILATHFSIILWYKKDRNEAVKEINRSLELTNEVTVMFNEALRDLTPKLDSINEFNKRIRD